ncbi:MAG: HAD hydrolase family protein [bacterium]|nr:HAD hydrolase family protein [bacterium]
MKKHSINSKTKSKINAAKEEGMKKYVFRNEGLWALQHLDLDPKKKKVAWDEFIQGLYAIFTWAFNGEIEIVSHDLCNLEKKVLQKVDGFETISIDPCVKGSCNVGTSRIFLPGGKIDTGIAGRPGFGSFEKQLSKIPSGGYVLIEDDIFSGGTFKQVLRLLEAHGITIIKTVFQIQVGNPKAINIPIESLEKYESGEIIDLNDPRDFLAGSFGGGLVIQYSDGLVRAPYVLPFVDSHARSSIPKEKVLNFSKRIWELNIAFWQNFPEIEINDGEKYFARMLIRMGYSGKEKLVDVCKDMLNLLNFPDNPPKTKAEKGIIFIDLNDTFIDNNNLTVSAEELKTAISKAQEKGWEIGLCSDSPEEPLKKWAVEHGINGPVIYENGQPVLQEKLDTKNIKKIIGDWAKDNAIEILPETIAPEFGGKICGDGIALGYGRKYSISIFCWKDNSPNAFLTEALGNYLNKNLMELDIDCAPEYGFIGIHSSDYRKMKGKALRAIGWALHKENKECWMLGNSVSDATQAPALCGFGSVANASDQTKNMADIIAKSSFTQGVIELIEKIIS